jgi:chromate reductase, NAD(P)H dehydrogenase (quinone)
VQADAHHTYSCNLPCRLKIPWSRVSPRQLWNNPWAFGVRKIMNTPRPVRILAISGSLRRASSNSALVAAARRVAPDCVHVSVFHELGDLPAFNPDLESDHPPEGIISLRAKLRACDAVLISSPEYAHGIPGALKNALDWVVGSGEFIDKPVALINASTRATRAWASLAETLSVMSARVILDASITIPVQGRPLDADGIAGDSGLSTLLRSSLETLAEAATF